MKARFSEYYELPEERIKEIWDNSLIVFDTNVLLNLYRYNEDARTEFINVIKFYKERLWIPYQVGLEFHRRREEIMRKNAKAYNVLAEKLSKELVGIVSSLEGEYARHPYINMKDIKSRVKKCADSIKRTLDKQEKVHPDFSKGDETLNTITELFNGKVGADFSEKELEALYKDGEKRYANKVPPGYCDEKNKKDNGKRSLYGDLIVWKQTLGHCKEQKRNAIFITDDYKTDWWDKVEGKHSPRKELIKEFADYTEQGVIIYDSSRFLDYAKRNKELIISAKTIKEVEKVKNDNVSWVAETTFPSLYPDTLFGDWGMPATMFPHKSRQLHFWDEDDEYRNVVNRNYSYFNPSYINRLRAAWGYVGLQDLFENPNEHKGFFDGLNNVSTKILTPQSNKK